MKFRPAKKEYGINDLPLTRKDQFFDLIKTRFSLFLEIGGILLLFATPFLFAFIIKYFVILKNAEPNLNADEFLAFKKFIYLIFDGIYCLCFLLIFTALAGIGRIIKEWVWGKGVYFWHDFIKGIKENFFLYLGLWFIFSIFFLINEFLYIYIDNDIVYILFGGFSMLLLPLLMMIMSQSVIYNSPFNERVRNSFFYLVKKPFVTLLFLLFPYAILSITIIHLLIVEFFVFALAFLLFCPFYIVGWYLFSLSLFDEYTNKEFYPSFYKKGLREEFLPKNNENEERS